MSLRTMEARAIISATDKTGSVFARVGEKIRRLESTSVRANRAGAAMAQKGAATMAALGRFAAPAALAAGAVAASKNFAAYDRQLTYLANTADATADQMAGVRKEIGATSRLVAETPDEVLKGTQTYIAALGDVGLATKATRETARAAKAFGTDITDQAAAGVAVIQNLGIAVERLNRANEIMAAGANIGMFEPKDMAKHLPSIAAAAKELKVVGEAGLGKLVAHLEVVRTATGDSATAANDYYNFLSKIVAKQTIDNVRDMAKEQGKNVDLVKEIERGYEKGTDAVETFLRVTKDLTKGNPNKVKELVPDMQANRALTALLSQYDQLDAKIRTVMQSVGLVDKAFKRVMSDQQSDWDKLFQAADRYFKFIGERTGLSAALGKAADLGNKALDTAELPPAEQARQLQGFRRSTALAAAGHLKAQAEAAAKARLKAIDEEMGRLKAWPGTGSRDKIDALEREKQALAGELDGSRRVDPAGRRSRLQESRWEYERRRLGVEAWNEPDMPPPTFPMPPGGIAVGRVPEMLTGSGDPRFGKSAPLPPPNPQRPPPVSGFDDPAAVLGGGTVKAVVEGPVTASVTGEASVTVRLQVDASPELRAVVREAVSGKMRIQSAPTGTSMPEAEPPTGGASGGW